MELAAYIRLVRRWFWLIGLAAILAGSVSFIVSRTQPPQYQSTTTIQVGSYLNLANPNAAMIQTGEQLAQTYAALAKTYPVMAATVDKLKLPFSPDRLSRLFQTRIIPSTSLLSITVTYTAPDIAADIANELAQQLIRNSATNLTQDQQQQLVILQGEVETTRAQLQDLRGELSTIDASLDAVSSEEREVLLARKKELTDQINAAQANLAQMTATVVKLQQEGNINTLTVVEPARIPESPVGSSTVTNTLLAGLVAAVLAGVVAFLIEYVNDSVRSPAEVMPLLNIAPIGTIAPFGKKHTYNDKLIAWTEPRSTISEAYRALRVNLMYAEGHENGNGSHDGCHVYVVTSPGPSEGKSVTAANLAVTLAITGMRVLVIDADLRRPTQHLLFNVPNSTGLSSLWAQNEQTGGDFPAKMLSRDALSGDTAARDDTLRKKIMLSLPYMIQKTVIPGLEVIPSGVIPSNPAELLGTAQMQQLVLQLVVSKYYDAIIFDTPPLLVVSDTSVLANVARAGVILVIHAGRTRRGSALRAAQQLAALSIQLLGVVVNRLDPRDLDTAYGQYYYYGYYGYGQGPNSPQNAPTGNQNTINQR
jgi:polysaccharide biosynthesis transport protein